MSLDQRTLLSSGAQVMFPPCWHTGGRRGRRRPPARARNHQTSHGAGNPDVPRNKVAPLVDIEPIKDMERRAEFAVFPLLRLVPLRGTPVGFTSDGWLLAFVLVTRRSFVPPCPRTPCRPRLSSACLSPCISIGSHDQRIQESCACVPPLSGSQRSRVGRVFILVTGKLLGPDPDKGTQTKLSWSCGPRLASLVLQLRHPVGS